MTVCIAFVDPLLNLTPPPQPQAMCVYGTPSPALCTTQLELFIFNITRPAPGYQDGRYGSYRWMAHRASVRQNAVAARQPSTVSKYRQPNESHVNVLDFYISMVSLHFRALNKGTRLFGSTKQARAEPTVSLFRGEK